MKHSFKLQIFFIFLIPAVVLIYFTSTFVTNKYEKMEHSSVSLLNAKFIKKVEELIHSLQIERGLSAGYIVAPNMQKITLRVMLQRKTTDKKFQNFLSFIQQNNKQIVNFPKFESEIKEILQNFSKLEVIRDKIDKQKISYEDEINYYTTVNKKLLYIVYVLTSGSKYNVLLVNPPDIYKIQEIKEYAGLERAAIFNQILSKKPSIHLYRKIQEYSSKQQQYTEEFLATASVLDLKIYVETVDAKIIERIRTCRNKLFDEALQAKDSMKWFDTSSKYIDQLKTVSFKMLDAYQKQMLDEYMDSREALYIAALLWGLLLLSFVILLIFLSKLVNQQMKMIDDLKIASYVFDAKEAIAITDAKGKILRVNNAFTQITGYTPQEAIGQTPAFLKSGKHDETFYNRMWKELYTKGFWNGEIYNRRKNGEIYAEQLSITAIEDEKGDIRYFIAQFLDVSELKQAQEDAIYQANHDFLTNLPNRKLMIKKLQEELIRAKSHHFTDAFLFIDLDGFKKVNDTYGHSIGDRLLVNVASLIKECLREDDFVSRISGDEFCVIVQNLEGDEEECAKIVKRIATKILQKLSTPQTIGKYKIQVSGSIGIRLFPLNVSDVNDIINGADAAMYKAKEQGKNQFVFFNKALEAKMKEISIIESELKSALENNEIKFYFQPKLHTQTNEIYGVEMLIRWEHRTKGVLYPGYFLDVAKDMQLLGEFTKRALKVACEFLLQYGDELEGTLSINMNSSELSDKEFVDELITLIERYDTIDTCKIEFEILESELIHDFDNVISNILKLKEKGIQFSIDDFGTGYSSISYLEKLPVNSLKVDRYFIGNFHDSANKDLIKMIINIAKSFNFSVVVEGVEEVEQLEFIKENGAHYYQGFLFSEAVNKKSFIKMITH